MAGRLTPPITTLFPLKPQRTKKVFELASKPMPAGSGLLSLAETPPDYRRRHHGNDQHSSRGLLFSRLGQQAVQVERSTSIDIMRQAANATKNGSWAQRSSARRQETRPLRAAAPRRNDAVSGGPGTPRELLGASRGRERRALPEFIKDEFDAFLECGILAHGFLRLRCGECGHEKLVAFSCKRRGFCPSCGARRMAQSAAHLVDCVIPRVPVRQWVLSFPIPPAHPVRRPSRSALAAVADHPPRHCQLSDQTIGTANAARLTAVRSRSSSASARRPISTFICIVWCSMACIGSEGVPVFHEARAPERRARGLLLKIIPRIMRYDAHRLPHRRARQELSRRSRFRSRAHALAGGRVHLSHCAGATRRTKSAEPAKPAERPGRPPPGCDQRARLQPACGGALWRLISARNSNACAAISPARRSPTNGSSAIAPASRAPAQELLTRRHHPYRHVAAGVHAAPGGLVPRPRCI